MSDLRWGLFNDADYPVAIHRRRSDCIEAARDLWGPGWSWQRIKRRYGWYVARVVVTREVKDG